MFIAEQKHHSIMLVVVGDTKDIAVSEPMELTVAVRKPAWRNTRIQPMLPKRS